MTTRPGAWAQQTWRTNRTKHPCNLVRITRTDGSVLAITDHDRPITLEGVTYRPAAFAGLSAERREAAMRSGNQEAYGIIDGENVTLPDLLGDRYRGAEVAHILTDWEMPLLVIARHRKWIRSVTWTGSAFVATLEGRTQVLTRPAGGRFGGTYTSVCPYKLGGEYCKKVLDGDLVQRGVRVQSIVKQRMNVETVSTTWTDTFDDDYFRDGDILWRWSAPVAFGTVASIGSTTLTDASQSWTVDEHVGRDVRVLATSTSGPVVEYARITANTADTLTFAPLSTTYGSTSFYDICGLCQNAGHVSPIAKYADGTRGLTLNFPTPFPIAVGDSGIVTVGCDGLKTTCKTKFGNLENFGGDAEAPSAGRIITPVIADDRDGDGFPDSIDAYPDDPTQH